MMRWDWQPRRRMARPRRRYDLTILRDAVLILVVLLVLIAASTTGYQP